MLCTGARTLSSPSSFSTMQGKKKASNFFWAWERIWKSRSWARKLFATPSSCFPSWRKKKALNSFRTGNHQESVEVEKKNCLSPPTPCRQGRKRQISLSRPGNNPKSVTMEQENCPPFPPQCRRGRKNWTHSKSGEDPKSLEWTKNLLPLPIFSLFSRK